MAELVFNIELDEDGNYCARAQLPTGSLHTDARDLGTLVEMIRDLIALYEEDEAVKVQSFSLRFNAPVGVAA